MARPSSVANICRWCAGCSVVDAVRHRTSRTGTSGHWPVSEAPASSSEAPPSFDAPTVCIDFKSPKAYLALAPTFALEDALDVRFDWLPISVSPLGRPGAARVDEDRSTRHKRMRAEYNERDLRRYARV